jgi:hypothetical protein
MIKPNSHLEKMLKIIAAKKKLKPEDALTEIMADYYKKVTGKSYLI